MDLSEVCLNRTQDFKLIVRKAGRKEGNVLFNDALNTFYLRLYGVRHMVEDHTDNEGGNQLPPYALLFPISSKGSFICMSVEFFKTEYRYKLQYPLVFSFLIISVMNVTFNIY